MPPKSENNYTLYWRDPQLGDVMIIPEVVYEITVSADALTPEAMSLLQPMEFTVQAKPPKNWRCRSRKRFIKLLMSKGISRNEAESVARVARIAGVTYRELWQGYFFWEGGD